MSAIILGIVAIVIIAVVIVLSLNYKVNQSLKCPSCLLDFSTDLFFLGQNTLVSCPFCHRWMVISFVSNRNVVKKLFEGQRSREERGPNE